MSAPRAKAKQRPIPVVSPDGVVIHADARTLPAPTCHLSHCPESPAPGAPTLLCVAHHAAAKGAAMVRDGTGLAWGACLRGCGLSCELGKWTGRGNERHYQPPKSGCEHLPAHLIHIAQGTLRRRPFIND